MTARANLHRSPNRHRARSSCIGLILLVCTAPAISSRAHADWIPNGVQVVPWDGIEPSLLGDGTGGAFLAWDYLGTIRHLHLGSDGTVPPGLPGGGADVVSTGYDQRHPTVVPDDVGGIYVVWADERWAQCQAHCFGTPLEIYVVRLVADGSVAPGWPAAGINTGAPPLEWTTPTRACADGAGGVIIAWSEPTPTDAGNIHARRYAPDGQSVWGSTPTAVCSAAGSQVAPRVVADGAGGAVIVWQDERGALGATTLYAQRIASGGGAAWPTNGVPLGTTPGLDAAASGLVADTGGGAFVAWSESGAGVWLAHLASTGGADWGFELDSADAIIDLCIADDGAGGVLGAWSEDRGAPSGRDLHLLHLARSGTPPSGWTGPEVVCDAPALQFSPRLAHDEAGGTYLLWRDDRSGATEMFATRIDATGSAAPGWPVNGRVICSASGPRWVEALARDGEGGAIALWGDQRDIPSEVLYAQRIVPGGVLDVPPPATFTLLAPWPNPARRRLAATIVLPDAAPARLELIDIAGRQVMVRDVGALGAGRHTIALDPGAVPPGLYVLRLSRAEGARSVRVAFLR